MPLLHYPRHTADNIMLALREAVKWLFRAIESQALVASEWLFIRPGLLAVGLLATSVSARAVGQLPPTNSVEVLVIQGTVEVERAGQSVWDLASTQKPYCRLNPGDQIRTKDRSRATVRLSDLT